MNMTGVTLSLGETPTFAPGGEEWMSAWAGQSHRSHHRGTLGLPATPSGLLWPIHSATALGFPSLPFETLRPLTLCAPCPRPSRRLPMNFMDQRAARGMELFALSSTVAAPPAPQSVPGVPPDDRAPVWEPVPWGSRWPWLTRVHSHLQGCAALPLALQRAGLSPAPASAPCGPLPPLLPYVLPIYGQFVCPRLGPGSRGQGMAL